VDNIFKVGVMNMPGTSKWKLVLYAIWLLSAAADLSRPLGFLKRKLAGGWSALLGRFILLIIFVLVFSLLIAPIDPLDLEHMKGKINMSSDDGPIYNLLIRGYVLLNDDNTRFEEFFSTKDAFAILLSNPLILDCALNDKSLDAAIMNDTVIGKISNSQDAFNSTFSNETILASTLSNKTVIKRLLNNRDIYRDVLLINDIREELSRNNITYWIDVPVKCLFDMDCLTNNINLGNKSTEVRWSYKNGTAYYLFLKGSFYYINNIKELGLNNTAGVCNRTDMRLNRSVFGIFLANSCRSNQSACDSIIKSSAINASDIISIVIVRDISEKNELKQTYIDATNNSDIIVNALLDISGMDFGNKILSTRPLLDLTLKKAYDDIELRELFYHEAMKDNSFKKNLKNNISNIEELRSDVAWIIAANDELRIIVLNDIYNDARAKKEAYLLIDSNKELQRSLFKYNYKLTYLIAIIWFYWSELLAIWIAYEVIRNLKNSRRVLSISYLDENTGGEASDQNKNATAASSTLLAARLGNLNQLYRQVDEGRKISSMAITSNPVPAAFESRELQGADSNIIADEVKLSVGPISVPVKLINGLIDTMIKQPKLCCGFYKYSGDSDSQILAASLTGWSRHLTWRVNSKDEVLEIDEEDLEKEKPSKRPTTDMVAELAYRIFTDLTFDEGQIIPWKATWYFTEGVRCYRDSLHGRSDRLPKLHQAVKFFISARSQDEDFPWAHYNLGVVYTELKQYNSAKEAFEKSIVLNPDQWQSCYALALNLFENEKNFNDTIALCNKALYLKPDPLGRAKIYDLRGLALMQKNQNGDYESAWNSLVFGSIYSMLGLIMAKYRGNQEEEACSVASKCLSDLAGLDSIKDQSITESLLDLAISRSPNDSYLHSRLAEIYECSSKEKARNELDRSASPANTEYWADVASFNIKYDEDTNNIYDAILEVLNDFSDVNKKCLHKIIKSMKSRDECIRFGELREHLTELYDIKALNCPDGTLIEFATDHLPNWKNAKKNLNKLWPERDSLCLISIRAELRKRKIDDEQNALENIYRLQVQIDKERREFISDLRNSLQDSINRIHPPSIEIIIKKLNDAKSEYRCECKFSETIEALESAMSSFCTRSSADSMSLMDEITCFMNRSSGSQANEDQRVLEVCRELKYAYILKDLGDIYYLCGLVKTTSEDRIDAVKQIYDDIFDHILVCSKDTIPHEYERLKEGLRRRWNVDLGKSENGELKRYQELAIKYPLNAFYHMNLGRALYRLNHYKLARYEWKQALLLNPDDPRQIFNIGLTYFFEAAALKMDDEVRKDNYKKAQRYFEQALDLSEDTRSILKTYYWLGRLHYSNRDYNRAIGYFRMGKSMLDNGLSENDDVLIFKHDLGCACLNHKKYDECEELLSGLVDRDDGNAKKVLGKSLGIYISMGTLMIMARLNLAESILQRDADLDIADKWIEQACRLIQKTFTDKDRTEKDKMEAYWNDLRGWYLYKKHMSSMISSSQAGENVRATKIRIPKISGSRAVIKSSVIAKMNCGAKDCQSTLEHKDKSITLKNYTIKNTELTDVKCNHISIEKLNLNSGLLKSGCFSDSIAVKYDVLEKSTIRYNGGKGEMSIRLFGSEQFIESALIEDVSIADFVIENAILDQAELMDVMIESEEIKAEVADIDESIRCLMKSISLAASPSAYLHLALAYECKLQDDDQKNRDKWMRLALSSCQHCEDLDLDQEFKEELNKLRACLNGTKSEASSDDVNNAEGAGAKGAKT